VWDCGYHLIWATKRRRRALTGEEERRYCERLLRRVAEKYDMFVAALEVDEDHVHLYVEIPPQLSVGKAVRLFKSLSARHMLRRFPNLRRHFWSGAMWSPSYFVRTVGEGVTAETVRRYITTHEERSELGPAQVELFAGRVGPRRRKRKA
jgi:putative transposase